MNEEYLVTIECLVYNHEPYIRQCLDGFVKQKTNFKFKAIIHDDCSTDNSRQIISEYAEKYPDIIIPIYEKENQYSKGTNNIQGIINEYLNTKYTAFCEGDDYWIDENKLQMQFDYMESNSNCGLCYTNFKIQYGLSEKYVDNALLLYADQIYSNLNDMENWIIKTPYTAPMSWFFRTDLLKKEYEAFYEINKHNYDDTFVLFAYFLGHSEIHCFEKNITCVYRLLQESASHSRNVTRLFQISKGILFEQLFLIDYFNLSEILKRDCIANFTNQKRVIIYQILTTSGSELGKYTNYITKKNKIILKISSLSLGKIIIRILLKILNYHL